MARAAIFDMDGVIIDSEPLYAKACNEILLKAGVTQSLEELGVGVGGSLDSEKAYLKKQFPKLANWDEIYKQYEHALEVSAAKAPAIEGSLELINSLASSKVPLAVCSNSLRRVVKAGLGAKRIEALFAAIMCREDVPRGKPFPDPYIEACKRLGLTPSQCIAVEDSLPGIKSAKAAGCKTVFVNTNNYPLGEIKKNEPDLLVEKTGQIDAKQILKL